MALGQKDIEVGAMGHTCNPNKNGVKGHLEVIWGHCKEKYCFEIMSLNIKYNIVHN